MMEQQSLGLTQKHLSELLSIIEIGAWEWDLTTGKVIYSAVWAKLLGYRLEELPQTVETWEKMVLPEDLDYANEQINMHLSGKKQLYEAEFRMICKDGSIIWAQDKGKVIEFDEEGRPYRFVGILQNVMRLKMAQQQLRENQETLDLAVSVAGLGTWDWDIPGNQIRYNDEYLQMLGYSQSDINGSLAEWEAMNHPEDSVRAMKLLNKYLAGEIPSYECEIRMKKKDGSFIWTRDVGRVVSRDWEGNPTRLIGGHLNIDALKCSEEKLTKALETLENNERHLVNEIESRTKELVEQDKMLWTVNQISRKLLAFGPEENIDTIVQECLRLLGESINESRVYIWKDFTDEQGDVYCTQIYEWIKDVLPIQGEEEYESIAYRDLPNFSAATESGRCLNRRVSDLSKTERAILEPQGIKSILIAPIAINGTRWGFIGVDNCLDEQIFTNAEENMLLMSGSMLANTMEKMDTEGKMREMEERTQIMLDATPLCCNLWTPEFKNMSCNEEAARLFELSSQKEYLERFYELSPEYQPSGRKSEDMVAEYLTRAFQEGYYRFEWMHQKTDGTPIPTEVTLVRIRYKGSFIVAGYTRDLREIKATLDELRAKEDDLRAARDEALLSSKAKSNFLANMSHEIRTPMNAISGLAEIILRESSGGKSAEYASGIKSACNNLLNIINDILDISKIESGKLEIIHSQYELSSLLNDVITISRMRLADKLLMFITDIDSRLPVRLMGDEIRIKQILINMLSNAIKFTQNGYIALSVTGDIEDGKVILRFKVSDSGVGIKEEDLERLFAEFERVNTTKNRRIEGTGLGLAISKQLCEMMGGEIEVNSTFGKGSEFCATIPQEFHEYEPIARVDAAKTVLLYEPRELYRNSIEQTIENLGCECVSCENQSVLYETLTIKPYDYILTASLHLKKVQSLIKKNKLTMSVAAFAEYGEVIGDDQVYTILFPVNCLQIADLLNGHISGDGRSHPDVANANFTAPSASVLVVDDNPVNLSVAAGLMEPYQMKIETAVNGLEAVDIVKKHKYDLVFMDHMMPEMDGIDATAAIRRLEGAYYQDLPIVALTANALVGTREMFIREGMNDFLAKPIEINKLSHVLTKWLPKSKVIMQQPGETARERIQKPEWELEGIDVGKGILSVGGTQENYLNILSVYYEDGCQKAPVLRHYVAVKDIAAFRTEIHALKSASATIGAMYLSSLAVKLEAAAKNEDIEYIDGNIDDFLSGFQEILQTIRPVVEEAAKKSKEDRKPAGENPGDLKQLQDQFDKLYDATQIASISQIESIMSGLRSFSWPDRISHELAAIEGCIAMFDYDGVIECINRSRSEIRDGE